MSQDAGRTEKKFSRREFNVGVAAVTSLASTSALAIGPANRARQASTPATALSRARAAARLEAEFQVLTERGLFSGAVVLARQADIAFSGSYGMASREYGVPNALETQFSLASAAKMFTATAVMRLAEMGRLSLDDTIDRYVDDTWLDPQIASRVRIRQLLTHTSGVSDYFSPQFEEESRTRYREIEDFKPLVRNGTIMFEPGTRWAYSNAGYLLLGVIAAEAGGQNFFALLDHLVFGPAGMTSTQALELDHVNHGYAQGYFKEPTSPQPPMGPPPSMDGPPPPLPSWQQLVDQAVAQQVSLSAEGHSWRNNIFAHVIKGGPAGGMYSTASDLLAFCNAFTTGSLVSRRTVEAMQSPNPPPASHWGLGMHSMDGGWGHGGAFKGISTLVIMYPDGYRTIILSNVDAGAYVAYDAIQRLASTG